MSHALGDKTFNAAMREKIKSAEGSRKGKYITKQLTCSDRRVGIVGH